jgi:glycosyltransferase involved in cell wall biosynthesis
LEAELRRQVGELRLEEEVEFLGWLPHEKLMQMYEQGEVDVVVLPSIVTEEGEKEGIPVALMEAMAYGIPVISTETGGGPELLSGAGIIVPPKSPQALAEAIIELMKTEKFRRQLARLGRARVEMSFSLKLNIQKLLQLMEASTKNSL